MRDAASEQIRRRLPAPLVVVVVADSGGRAGLARREIRRKQGTIVIQGRWNVLVPALQAEYAQKVLTAAVECAMARCRLAGCLETWREEVMLQRCVGCATEGRSTALWPPICTEGLCTGGTYAGTRYHSDTHCARITCSVQRVRVQYCDVERRGEMGDWQLMTICGV